MNTASRMESNGLKNRIQVSQETADCLTLKGKGSWLKPREDMIEAKGKVGTDSCAIPDDALLIWSFLNQPFYCMFLLSSQGKLQTYWLEVRSSDNRTNMTSVTSGSYSAPSATSPEQPKQYLGDSQAHFDAVASV